MSDVYIHAIETAVPETVYEQAFVRDLMKAQSGLGRRAQRLVTGIYNASAIERRHSVITDLRPESQGGAFFDAGSGQLLSPSTGLRNERYTQTARGLFAEAASRALAACPALTAHDVTHVITVSCTGFFAPGPDYTVVRDVKLNPDVQRYHLGFMGCYAAFPALRAARAFCESDPQAVVLVICTELCSLHVRVADDPDTLIAGSVFADGAAAALVSARLPQGPALRLNSFATTLTPTGEEDMAWTIGDEGFEMKLSTYVPAIIEEHLGSALSPLLGPLAADQVRFWAIHPGGRSILDKVQTGLGLSDEQLQPSRRVLREYGNMSSATVLFVLREILHADGTGQGENVGAMAFGPGLTVESALLAKVPAAS
ncbi:type III polyketide synthase [Deinococcus peraridilitoris]|uniref:Putative naringenin-chalcone synthase n=1 Tax=Deinococcus peraridilitoris (strain DSM 19664 / LMG 22246 / CIP 109416 / KR-200) TaxID=937777 RepID=L0A545_DEIPD|nr:type III polyketide synthase [Deinococcus peraridilitoris]AFZ68564.1 putative naringenin-chalcone synthase [Deinococcus peraridilitoris DSM 19664]